VQLRIVTWCEFLMERMLGQNSRSFRPSMTTWAQSMMTRNAKSSVVGLLGPSTAGGVSPQNGLGEAAPEIQPSSAARMTSGRSGVAWTLFSVAGRTPG
jgi:hypothetical protein